MAELPARFDYIIIGAGSAGCVLAERLSADGRHQVLLVEAGGKAASPLVTMPKGIAKLVANPDYVWPYRISQPRHAGGKAEEIWIRGKGLGGSSSINGMIWSRGEPQDYDDWQAAGATGWDAEAMLAAYRQLEDHDLGPSPLRGSGGPVHVTAKTYRYPLAERMIAAGEQMGLKRTDDLNSLTGGRVGYYCHNIRHGRRQGGAKAFLRRASGRRNLHILTDMVASHVLLADGRATGVELIGGARGRFQVECAGEVILSAGTIESPQILQRSGIGDGNRLSAVGVPVHHHNPHVGRHMLEHLSYSMPFRLKRDVGIERRYHGLGLLGSIARYYLLRDGPMATGPFEVGAFFSTGVQGPRTDFQLYLSGYMFALGDGNDPVPLGNIDKRPGMTASGTLLRQTSEGEIDINGPNAGDGACICPNWLSTEEDRRGAVAAIRAMRNYAGQPILSDDVGEEVLPGASLQTDEEILDNFRSLSTSGLHGVGTCRMGVEGESVLDPHLRVRGVDGLRVIDCSAMPGLVTGNTNAPAMATGWRGADIILSGRR
ncbi:MAG: glucose-methanol-choline oxidoreductase [Sphingomonadales bacterium]|nr:MAG: glucose-methanol-choline oxidoreductase [Sphingomonadales bacterium]TNF06351.1 MAG: glucose-methanol-choline oxidoreductase [Sphingomonadales bacterium]